MMKRPFSILFCLLVTILTLGVPSQGMGGEGPGKAVRPSILAGSWYPESRPGLEATINAALSGAKVDAPRGKLKAILVPHAGYIYSGRVAAFAYKLLENSGVKRVIMIGPSHRAAFTGVSVNLQRGYQTPLGTVLVDQDLAARLIEADPDIRWVPGAHAREHSLEIQLPFLQTVLGDFQILPVLMGRQDLRTCANLAEKIVRVLGTGDDTLLLASTDLSHFHDARRARSLDTEFIEHIRRFDPEGLSRSLACGLCEACGGGPAVATMLVAREMGADRALVLNYAHSGDITGDHEKVVGYVSAAFFKGD